MIIKEGPNVTVTYSGYTLDTIFAIGQSLNLRYKTLNKRIKCDYQLNSVCSNLMNLGCVTMVKNMEIPPTPRNG